MLFFLKLKPLSIFTEETQYLALRAIIKYLKELISILIALGISKSLGFSKAHTNFNFFASGSFNNCSKITFGLSLYFFPPKELKRTKSVSVFRKDYF